MRRAAAMSLCARLFLQCRRPKIARGEAASHTNQRQHPHPSAQFPADSAGVYSPEPRSKLFPKRPLPGEAEPRAQPPLTQIRASRLNQARSFPPTRQAFIRLSHAQGCFQSARFPVKPPSCAQPPLTQIRASRLNQARSFPPTRQAFIRPSRAQNCFQSVRFPAKTPRARSRFSHKSAPAASTKRAVSRQLGRRLFARAARKTVSKASASRQSRPHAQPPLTQIRASRLNQARAGSNAFPCPARQSSTISP